MMRRWLIPALIVAIALAGCSASGMPQSTGRLAFERTVDGNTDVYVMNVDGSGLTRLTDDPGWDGTPAWAPSGDQIAFASERQGAPVIYVMNADGTDLRALTGPEYASLMPVWSPDGKQIAFASTRSYKIQVEGGTASTDAGLEIWVMNADGSNPHHITGTIEDQAVYPTWSPKGDRLAYMRVSQDVQIVAQAPDSAAEQTVLTQGQPGKHWTPAWSPDGNKIAYMTEISDTRDIVLMPADGGKPHAITQAGSNETEPTWSPDGKQIAFISDRDGPLSLYVMDADGKNVRRLASDDAEYAHPAWSPK